MEKLNQLLNENTIVDFGFLWKLVLRYRSHLIAAVLFTSAIFSINYFQQPVIYAINVPIKAISNHTVSNDLSALLPVDNANAVTLNELKISMDSFSFLKDYASLVSQDLQFDNLNLGAITANKNLYAIDLKKACGKDKECLIERLASSLRGSFSIDQGLSDNRFILTVNALDKRTVKRLTVILLRALELNRVHVRQYLVLKEIQSVGSLIAESRSIMQKLDGYKTLEDQEKLQNNISDLKERIRMLQYSSNIEKANVTSLESRLTENKKSTKQKNTTTLDLEKNQKTLVRLANIKQDIFTLSNMPEGKRSATDSLIIAQLKEEQSELLKILPTEPRRKKMELNESFIEGQRGKSGDYEFDFQVAKNKLEKLNQDYEVSKTELNELLQQKIVIENKVIGMKSDLDFLKSLEAKQMSLKLLNATMTSDLFFEDVSSEAREFRQSTNLKIFIFSFSISFFFYLFSIILRYFFDDRIYGEEDIRGLLEGLDFVGEVPVFE
jgi:hypothetical protein